MANQSVPVTGFLDAIKSWVQTVEEHKPDFSTVHAAKLQIFGKLLAEDNQFERIFKGHLDGCSGNNAQQAMDCVYAFFKAVADTTRPGMFRSASPSTADH
jgi:hypothetical protein